MNIIINSLMASMEEIFAGIGRVEDEMGLGESDLRIALACVEDARENLQAVAEHSANPEHARAIALFSEAEVAIRALQERLGKFHSHTLRYVTSFATAPGRAPVASDQSPSVVRPEIPEADSPKVTKGQGLSDPERYEKIADRVRKCPPTTSVQDIDGYLGKGANSIVIDAGNDEVVKIINSDPELESRRDPVDADNDMAPVSRRTSRINTVKALKRAKGLPGTEQLIGYTSRTSDDPSSLIIVCKKIPGKTLSNTSDETMNAIPDKQFEDFIDTLAGMEERKVAIDNNRGNIMYDPHKGLTVLDYTRIEDRYSTRSVPETIVLFASPSRRSFLKVNAGDPLPQYAVHFYGVVKRKLGESVAAQVREEWKNCGNPLPKELH